MSLNCLYNQDLSFDSCFFFTKLKELKSTVHTIHNQQTFENIETLSERYHINEIHKTKNTYNTKKSETLIKNFEYFELDALWIAGF